MAIGSEFYKDVSKIEKKMLGISKRELKAYVLLGAIIPILLLEVFFLPGIFFYLFAVPTSFVLGYYPVHLLLNSWRKKKRKIKLYFYYEDRPFKTGQIRRYEKDEFIPEANVKETDEY